ncbi:hypothetical protein BDV96DRAFT_645660 [Lophiotrema nucula]|uniref:Actin-like ATPase domain-containing protein n=1 Tax=Lophiotrema nucula TaxID=690887 RepID=A0A6A5ZA43_9PLEO|nr:hypothetical protein BDV96DRAFT_645660 [Lophiotrema nucula]
MAGKSAAPSGPPSKRARTAHYSSIGEVFDGFCDNIRRPEKQRALPFRVGLDFGTTMTTVAYADTSLADLQDQVHTIHRWPGNPWSGVTRTSLQVPSEAAYPTKEFVAASRLNPHSYNDKVCPGYKHGYEVQTDLGTAYLDQESEGYIRIERPKNLLDKSSMTAQTRRRLEKKLQVLGKSAEDVITDYLTVIFEHAKNEMLDREQGFTPHSEVEVVFGVPISWLPRANAIMAQCVLDAMHKAEFAIPKDGSPPKLFMVNEAEAAATWALRGGIMSLSRGETFVLLDCGGGTVDAGTFKIARAIPLRLESDSCGANLTNDCFFDQIWTDLRQETQLGSADNIKSIIDRGPMYTFENSSKRRFAFTGHVTDFEFPIYDLKNPPVNRSRRLGKQKYILTHGDMKDIFSKCLDRTSNILTEQIIGAVTKGVKVDKVVVVGGFSDSSALRFRLQEVVEKLNEDHGLQVWLVYGPEHGGETGVAHGAIHRGNNKELGPKRIPVMSYGIVRHYWLRDSLGDPEMTPLKKGSHEILGDGRRWATDRIEWLIKKGDGPLASVYTSSFISQYQFTMDDSEDWQRYEAIYSSETATKSFFDLKAPENEDVEKVGEIHLDLRSFKDKAVKKGRVYELDVLVEMEVIDRNLSFKIVWPAMEEGKVIPGGQGKFSMVAGFQPGTE